MSHCVGSRSRFLRFGVLFVGALTVSLCHGSAAQVQHEMLVTTEWLASHLDEPNLVVLCVAEDEPFCSPEHIPGARWIRLADIVTTRNGIPNELPSAKQLERVFAQAGVKNDSRIVIYGDRDNLLAARAYFTLDYLGLATHAALLDGGWKKWKTENRPISTAAPHIVVGELKAHVHPEVVITARELANRLRRPGVLIVDARPSAEFNGERLSEDVVSAGHIPTAVSLYWHDLLTADDTPALLPESQLQSAFQKAGIQKGDAIISYCRTGMQSSMDYFVARYLGYSARMYDGSIYEWSRERLPMEKSIH